MPAPAQNGKTIIFLKQNYTPKQLIAFKMALKHFTLQLTYIWL